MRKSFLKKIILLTIILISFNSFACDCYCDGDCSFSKISNKMEFVALIKVIEYSDFLEDEIIGYDKKMPFSMTVEIIKKYKGDESRKLIKIWGDNGMLCRPYLSEFTVGECYLIAPSKIEYDSPNGKVDDFDFFVCWTDYLQVDLESGIAYGEYSPDLNEIELKEFEKYLIK